MNLNKRMAAEGLPSIPVIADAIISEGNKMKTGGIDHHRIEISTATLVAENLTSHSYHGGFNYPGWQAKLDGEPL